MSLLSATLFCRAPELTGTVSVRHKMFGSYEKPRRQVTEKEKVARGACALIAAKRRIENTEKAYLDAIKSGHVTSKQIAKHLNREISSVYQHLKKMHGRGLIRKKASRIGKTKSVNVWDLA